MDDLDVTKDELEGLKKYPVDFISFSYYMSTATDITNENNEKVAGNLLGGVKNPYLKATDWGWHSMIDIKFRYLSLKTEWELKTN